MMGHEGYPGIQGPQDRRSNKTDKSDDGEYAPGAGGPEPESLIHPDQRHPDEQPDRDQRRHRGAVRTNALLQLALVVRMLKIRAQRMDRSHTLDINDADIHSALSTHFEDARMFCRVVDSVFRS